MCQEYTHVASTNGSSLPPAPASPELVHMRALEEQAEKDPSLGKRLRAWAQRFVSIII